MSVDRRIAEAVAKQIEKAAVEQMLEAAARQAYDIRHPHWREELREYMEKRGVTKITKSKN